MPLQQSPGNAIRVPSTSRPHTATNNSNNSNTTVNKHIQPKPAAGATVPNTTLCQAINLSTTNIIRQVQPQPRAKTSQNVRPTVTNVTSSVSLGQPQVIANRPITTLSVPKVVTMATLQQQQQILKQQQLQPQMQQASAKQGVQKVQQAAPTQILSQPQVILQQPQLGQQTIRIQPGSHTGIQPQIILHSTPLLQPGARLAGQHLQTSPQLQQSSKQITPQLIRLQHAIPAHSFTQTTSTPQSTPIQPVSAIQHALPIPQSTANQSVSAVNLQQNAALPVPSPAVTSVNIQQPLVGQSFAQQPATSSQPIAAVNLQQATLAPLSAQQPISGVIPLNCQIANNAAAALQSPQFVPQSPLSKTQQATVALQQQKVQQIQAGLHHHHHHHPGQQQITTTLIQPQQLIPQCAPQSLLRQPLLQQQQAQQGFPPAAPALAQQMPVLRPKSPGKMPAMVDERLVAKSPGRPSQSRSPSRHFKPITPVKQECEKIYSQSSEKEMTESHVDEKPTVQLLLPTQSVGSTTSYKISQESKMKSVDLCCGSPSQKGNVAVVKTENVAEATGGGSTVGDNEEPDFVWEEYLEETGAVAAPPTSFKHVENSLQSGFSKGMKLEVPNKASADSYWVASIIMTCGPLLRLRYDGYEDDNSADFWCDILKSDVHPIGWCGQNGKNMQPPEAIKSKFTNWTEFLAKTLSGARTAPAYLLDRSTGTAPMDQIKQGMKLEVRHDLDPYKVWFAKVLENVGGRLLLRHEGTDDATNDFWLFYLDEKVHPVGWAKGNNCSYKPPANIEMKRTDADWEVVLTTSMAEAEQFHPPEEIFKDQDEVIEHEFSEGWYLECINPHNLTQICPAHVSLVIDKFFFIVEIDDASCMKEDKVQYCCHSNSHGLFPIGWSSSNGLKITPPSGWDNAAFEWDEYLSHINAEAAPESAFTRMVMENEFKRGMKLEAVNPAQPHQICTATITKLIDSVMWVHLDCSPSMLPDHMVDVDSHHVFPVGWCESNGYPLKPPRKTLRNKKVAVVQPEKTLSPDDYRSATYSQIKDGDEGRSKSWCPKIYFNHKCFSGPYLSKGRIAELPKCVGPGPVTLVMKEVLSMLINVAYKSSRVLREIQLESRPSSNMYQQTLKAKYKGKSYRAVVEIIKNSDQIDNFCRQICIKLECCPNLFSKNFVNGNCPENCSQLTKTKYTYYYGKKKKRKIGRPPGGHTNLENGPRKPGKRRKRRKVNLIHRKKRAWADSDGDAEVKDDEVFDGEETRSETTSTSSKAEIRELSTDVASNDGGFKPPRKKRKYVHHIPPPSEIKTRGAKLPKYSFERKTHKKVLLSESGTKSSRHSSAGLLTRSLSAPQPVQKVQPQKPPVESPKFEVLKLDSNPLEWSVARVVEFIKTTDCAYLARIFREQEIDGQALLLLSLPTVQEHMELKLGPAIKLCHHIEKVKVAFFHQFAK